MFCGEGKPAWKDTWMIELLEPGDVWSVENGVRTELAVVPQGLGQASSLFCVYVKSCISLLPGRLEG